MSEKQLTVILGTHPNEEIGRVIGAMVVGELRRRGRSVEVVVMPEIIGGKLWHEAFSELGGCEAREKEEDRIAEEAGYPTITFHDGPLPFNIGGKLTRHNRELVGVEVNAPDWEETSDPERCSLARIVRKRGDQRIADRIGFGSKWDSVAEIRLKPEILVPKLADLIEEVEEVREYFDWTF